MEWWEYDEPPAVPEDKISWQQKFCTHEWKYTTLIISQVADCTKCGVKREEFEAWENGEK